MFSMDKYFLPKLTILKPCHQIAVTSFDDLNCIQADRAFMKAQEIESFARKNLQVLIPGIEKYIEQDMYYILNCAYDFLLNYYTPDYLQLNYIEDALSYWSKFDEEVKNDENQKLLETYIKARKKCTNLFPEFLLYDKKCKTIKVSKLCPNLGLYVYKNIKDMFWYKRSNKEYDKYLLCRFLEAEKYNFTDSEYYLLEQITNINSVIALSAFFSQHISTTKAQSFMEYDDMSVHSGDAKEVYNYIMKHEIDCLISSVAASPLIYSKIDILHILFEESAKHMDIEGEFNHTIRYITMQFNMLSGYLSGFMWRELQNKFPENFEQLSADELELAKKENKENFLSNNPEYVRNSLIKNQDSKNIFSDIKKANKKEGYLNVYIQKKFIDILHYQTSDWTEEEYINMVNNNQ